MKKQLKCLEDTIAEIEREIEENPHPFLITTLERLRLYKDHDIAYLVEKKDKIGGLNKKRMKQGFSGFGVS